MLRLALLLLLAPAAWAVPLELVHQGRLLDAAGGALDGAHTLDLAIYDAPAGGTPLWSESQDAELDNGFFSVRLGAVSPLDADTFSGEARWLGIAVDGGSELPTRLALSAVPFAITAGNVRGGIVDGAEIRVNGTTVIDGSGAFVTLPADLGDGDDDTLAQLSCASGEVARFDGSGWACAPEADHAHDAGDIVGGTLGIGVIPVGTSADTVAAGDHAHTAADVGALPIEGGTLTGALAGTDAAFSGSVRIGDTDATCGSTSEGTFRWTGDKLEFCDGEDWLAFRLLGKSDGSSQDGAGRTCKTIHDQDPTLGDGVYWIDPDGSDTSDAFQAYCDMKNGGWALVASVVTQSDFWKPTTYNSSNSARAKDIGTADPGQNYVMHLAKWRELLQVGSTKSLLKVTVRRIDNDADVQLGILQGLQMNTNGTFTNPNAAWDGFNNVKSATGACVIQYNSDFQGTIVNVGFQGGDPACTGWLGWNGSCGYPSLGHNGAYYGSGSNFSHACSLHGNYYCSGDNMSGSGGSGCYFKRKWYWIQ